MTIKKFLHNKGLVQKNYITTTPKNLKKEEIEILFKEQLNKFNGILSSLIEGNNLENNGILSSLIEGNNLENNGKKEELLKEINNYKKFLEQNSLDIKTGFKVLNLENYPQELLSFLENFSLHIQEFFNVKLDFGKNFLEFLVEKIEIFLDNKEEIFLLIDLKNFLEKELFEKIYNFLYIYEEEISKFYINPENKLVLRINKDFFKLETEKISKKEIKKQKKEYLDFINSQKNKKSEIPKSEKEYSNYLEIRKKTNEVNEKSKKNDYLANRPYPLDKPEIVEATGNEPQEKRLKELLDSMGGKPETFSGKGFYK